MVSDVLLEYWAIIPMLKSALMHPRACLKGITCELCGWRSAMRELPKYDAPVSLSPSCATVQPCGRLLLRR